MCDDLDTMRLGIVSLPFLEPQVTCYPALLLRSLAENAFINAECEVIHGHSEFAYQFLRSDTDFQYFRRLSREPYLGDLCLLPLLAGQDKDVLTERNAALRNADADLGFADALMSAFDAYTTMCAERLAACDVVGLTATHFQLVPSLILAHKLKDLDARVVLGGYLSCESVGQALLQLHDCLDVVVFGEAEEAWPHAIRHCLTDSGRTMIKGGAARLTGEPPDVIPVIETFNGTWIRKNLQVALEISRGCYWDKCDFCNFNAGYKSHFLHNDYSAVLHQMDKLCQDHDQRRFIFLDTAIPPGFIRHLRAEALKRDYEIFAEVRPDFSRTELEDFSRLGQITLQIGVESLVDGHLEAMVKNASVVDNLRSLLACKRLNIPVIWGVFVDHPKETLEHLHTLLERLRTWQHLPAPKYVTHCQLRPGSPLWQEREQFGHRVQPKLAAFDAVLPQRDEALEFFPHHEFRSNRPAQHAALISEIEKVVHQWNEAPRPARVEPVVDPLWQAIAEILDDDILTSGQVHARLKEQGGFWNAEAVLEAMRAMERENYIFSSLRMQRSAPVRVFTLMHLLEEILSWSGHAHD
ncbi:MAG: radical SAM protein [Paracoccaceae bacterium]